MIFLWFWFHSVDCVASPGDSGPLTALGPRLVGIMREVSLDYIHPSIGKDLQSWQKVQSKVIFLSRSRRLSADI